MKFPDTASYLPYREFRAKLEILDVTQLPSIASSVVKGNQSKWYDSNQDRFIKTAFDYQGIQWRDYLVENIAYQLGSQLGFNCVDYTPCQIKTITQNKMGCYCKNFLASGEIHIAFYRLYTKYYATHLERDYNMLSTQDRIRAVLRIFKEMCNIDARSYVFQMIVLDLLVGNEDRHLNNFGVIYNIQTKSYRAAPHFDSGLGLFEHDSCYSGAPLTSAIYRMHGKPFSRKLYKAYDAALEVLDTTFEGSLNLASIVWPSSLAREYVLATCRRIGLETVGYGRVLNESI